MFKTVRSSTQFVVLTVGLGMFSDLFLYALVVPILPFILTIRTHLDPEVLQRSTSLLLSLYSASAALFSPIVSVVADRSAYHSLPFLSGLISLAIGTSLFLFGGSLSVLIVARLLQGCSTAVVWTVGLALLLDTVGIGKLGVTMGSIFGVIGGAQLAAPLLGGWLFEKAGIKAVAAVALGLICVDFAMRLAVVEALLNAEQHNPDEDGAVVHTNVPSETNALIADSRSTQYNIPGSMKHYADSCPILIFLWDTRFLAARLLAFSQSMLLSAIDATLPIEVSSLLHFDSGLVSLFFLPLVLPFIILNPIFGRAVDRIGPKLPALLGSSVWVVVLVLLRLPVILVESNHGAAATAIWAVLLAMYGSCAAGVGSGSIVAVGHVADGYVRHNGKLLGRSNGKSPFAQIFAVNSVVFSGGLAIGPAVAGPLRDAIGYGNMNAVFAAYTAVAFIVGLVYLDGSPGIGIAEEET